MSNKLSFSFTPDKFTDFLSKLKDLSSIDECVKIKIDKDNILMYAMISNNSTVTALKSYSLTTSEYFSYDYDFTVDYVITNTPKVVKSLNVFLIGDELKQNVKLDIVVKQDAECMHVRTGLFSSGKLKISCVGSELFKIRDITHESLEDRLDPKMADWNFVVNKSDFINVKKLSSIYATDNKIIDITINEGVVTFSEASKWELIVGDSEDKEYHNLVFIKKYLSNIDETKEDIVFFIYSSFLLIKDDNSNLMLSYEQTWDE
jgi:hypothetical protein